MIITVGFSKGGTTKTTLSMMLALYFVEQGKKVLLIDVDGQEDLSRLCGARSGSGSEVLFGQPVSHDDLNILPVEGWQCRGETAGNLFFIPASHDKLADINAQKDPRVPVAGFFKNVKALNEHYDIIICDTPPSLGVTQMAAMAVSEGLVMTLKPDFNGCGEDKVKQYFKTWQTVKQHFNPNLRMPAVLLSAVDIKGNQAKDYVDWARKAFGKAMTSKYIEHSTSPVNAISERRAVWFKASSGNDRAKGAAFRRVIDELVGILKVK